MIYSCCGSLIKSCTLYMYYKLCFSPHVQRNGTTKDRTTVAAAIPGASAGMYECPGHDSRGAAGAIEDSAAELLSCFWQGEISDSKTHSNKDACQMKLCINTCTCTCTCEIYAVLVHVCVYMVHVHVHCIFLKLSLIISAIAAEYIVFTYMYVYILYIHVYCMYTCTCT